MKAILKKSLSGLACLLTVLLLSVQTTAQVSINTDGSLPDPSAGLDIKSSVKGLLAPRVRLESVRQAAPVVNPATGLVVLNTSPAGSPPDNVVPGYYYWNGSSWVFLTPPTGSAPGDMMYWNGLQWARIATGSPGQYLTMNNNGIPAWSGIAYPVVITAEVDNISTDGAGCGGEVVWNGGADVTERGVCYNTSPNPTIDNLRWSFGNGTGAFTIMLSGLLTGTSYYLKAYAINTLGVSYGQEVTFTTIQQLYGPTVITTPVTAFSTTTITCGGNVLSDGGDQVTERGVCWGTTANPTIEGNHTSNGTGTGVFASSITGLSQNTTYHIRAYATNYISTSYGADITQITATPPPPNVCPGTPSVTYAGKNYSTVKIGNQCWLRNNLDIGTMVSKNTEQQDNGIIERYCIDNNYTNCNTYGGLYQWGEAVQYRNGAGNSASWNPVPSGHIQGICPAGWHIPTFGEWAQLSQTLGFDTIAGGRLKEAGSVHWYYGNEESTNYSLFTALPGGYRDPNGWCYPWGELGVFVCATEETPANAWNRELETDSRHFYIQSFQKTMGLSVRCLKDTIEPSWAAVTTLPVYGVGIDSANVKGNVSSDGGAPVTDRGICWSTARYPTLANAHLSAGTGTGPFSVHMSGLSPLTTYVMRPYATNAAGTSYGNQRAFITGNTPGGAPCPGIPTVDYGGITYHTVQIGNQCWMQENLNIGTRINGTLQQKNNSVVEKFCYDDLESNCSEYGGLYQWAEAVQYLNGATNGSNWNPVPSGPVRGICPEGWHIPSSTEWCTLVQTLEPGFNCTDTLWWYGYQASPALREAGTCHWSYPNYFADNSSGFSARGGGYVSVTQLEPDNFWFLNEDAFFFTTTTSSVYPYFAMIWNVNYNSLEMFHQFTYKAEGNSIRCIKD